MKIDDLSFDEMVVFVGLVRHLVNTDDLISVEELDALRRLQRVLGSRWAEVARTAKQKFSDLDDVLTGAERVSRPGARTLITEQLEALAAADGVIAAEAAILSRLRALWHG